MANIVVTFVGDSRYDVSSAMHMAFDQSKHTYNLDPKWISVEECLKIDKSKLLKTDVFILENFSGPAFNHLQNCKALIIGTRCLLKCLSQAKELPPWNHPIYSLAMEGMQITSSGIKLDDRHKMQQYIEWMGGVYDKTLHVNTTHLVSNNVTSVKYANTDGKIPIMRPEWIEAIWEASNRDTIVGDCDEFLKESLKSYRLKPFHGLHITSAGLVKTEKENIKMCVEANSGTYMGNYKSGITDVLVLTHSGVTGAKYQAARIAGKECVTPDWIYDCDSAGYAIPMDKYRVGAKSSTPTKSDHAPTLDKNFSMISTLNETDRHSLTSVDESICVPGATSFVSFPKLASIENNIVNTPTSKSAIKNLFDMKEVRNAGLFLDGCGIYLSGFAMEDRDYLNRILNSGGATRYDDPCERISHVILSKPGCLEMQPFKDKGLTPFFVNIQWLVQSVKLKRLALEDDFILKDAKTNNRTCGKPMDFPGTFLDETFSPRAERLREIEQSKVLEMYKNASKSTTNKTESTITTFTEQESTIKLYFNKIKFFLYDLDTESHNELEMLITDAGGTLVQTMEIANYIIVPELCSKEIATKQNAQVVSPLFIRTCIERQDCIEVDYYHRPIMRSATKPLSGLVFTVSSYSGLERYYIGQMSEELGAIFTETMVRKAKPNNQGATTHLICKQANGQKYNACLLWGLPGVSVQWLLACARTQTRVAEHDYLVGDTKAPTLVSNSTKSNESTTFTNSGLERTLEIAKSSPRPNLKRMRTSSDERSLEENDINVPMNVSRMQTPIVNKLLSKVCKSPAMTQDTPPPVSKFLERLRAPNSGTPESPGLPLPEHMRTPASPYGAFLWGPNPTPETRKRWKRFCDGLPSPDSPMPDRTSPTWSAVKREAWAELVKPKSSEQKGVKLNFEDEQTIEKDNQTMPSTPIAVQAKTLMGVNTQVQKLNELLTSGGLGGNISNNRTLTPISKKPSLHNIDTINYDGVAKESQAESVGWRDPSELESVKVSHVSDSGLEEMQPFRKRPPRFLLSGVQAKEEIIENIAVLGGEILENFDSTCSHILSDAPGRTEKLLCGLSGGKWLLSTMYIAHCMKEGRFVEEESFEWGNPNGEFSIFETPNSEADACYRWRCKYNNKPVENKSEGAFTGWKVLLQTERNASFERVIQAGFGQVVRCKNIESLQEGSVSHCFCEPRKKTISTDQIRHLIRIGAQVLPVQYLNRFLTDHPPPDAKDYLITV